MGVASLILAAAAPAPESGSSAYQELFAQAQTVMLTDPVASREIGRKAQAAAEAQPPGPRRNADVAAAEWLQAEAALRMGDLRSARPLVDAALALFGSQPSASKLLGDIRLSRAGISAAEGNVSAALADYQEAHRIFSAIKDARSQAKALILIGILYKDADDNANALKYFDRSLDIYSGDPNFSISVLNNQAVALQDIGRFNEAGEKLDAALRMAQQLGSPFLQVQILGNIARMRIKMRQIDAATRAVQSGLALSLTGEAASWRPELVAISAEIAFERKQLAEARALIEQAFAGQDLSQTDAGYREAHYTAYAIYDALGDNAHALAHLRAMKRIDDKIWSLRASTNTALMAARFDSANQEARIAKAETKFQRTVFGGVTVGAIVLLSLLGFGLWQSRRARIRLSASNVALEKALAAKTEFLATTSHEIRTPLNGILGMTQVMLADPKLDTASRDRVGIVHGAGLTMRSLVDDILDVAKMETGNLVIEARPFDLRAMLEDVTRMWAEQARAKGLEFRLELADCPRGITGDAGRVRQVVYNLLSNAVKFTASGSVTVRAACAGDRMTIMVADTGIGIAADKHAEIFESFKQADGGTTRQFGGTGLGLAIVRNIVGAMDGAVAVDSAPGQGASFIVELPFVAAELAEPVAEAAAAGDGLLIVDRSPIARAMLKAVLEPRAGRVLFAGSCAEAIVTIGRESVARILIDEAAARADDADPFAEVAAVADAFAGPVAVLWSNLDDEARAALEKAGANQVVAKPIAGPALASALYTCNTEKPIVTRAA